MLGTYILIAVMAAGIVLLLVLFRGLLKEINRERVVARLVAGNSGTAGMGAAKVIFLKPAAKRAQRATTAESMQRDLPAAKRDMIKRSNGKVLVFEPSEQVGSSAAADAMGVGQRSKEA